MKKNMKRGHVLAPTCWIKRAQTDGTCAVRPSCCRTVTMTLISINTERLSRTTMVLKGTDLAFTDTTLAPTGKFSRMKMGPYTV